MGLSIPASTAWGSVQPPPCPSRLPAPCLTDRPGVTRREEIEQVQEEMALTLQTYIKDQQPRLRNRYGDMGAWRGHGEGDVLSAR